MRTVIIIPARFKSSRFPGKPLAKINGKELILWVTHVAQKTLGKQNVYVATDDNKIKKFLIKNNINFIMTSKKCLTGTDRVAEASKKVNSDIYINLQGDEPLVKPIDIKRIILTKKKFINCIICGYKNLNKLENVQNKNIPKVIFNEKKELIYISRSIIPGSKKNILKNSFYHKQVCIYAFTKKELDLFYRLKKKSKLEKIEDIEILRFFELNRKIKMVKTQSVSLAVDEKKDIKIIEKYLNL